MAQEAKERLNDDVQGVLAKGDDALDALRGWLQNGHRPAAASELQA